MIPNPYTKLVYAVVGPDYRITMRTQTNHHLSKQTARVISAYAKKLLLDKWVLGPLDDRYEFLYRVPVMRGLCWFVHVTIERPMK